MLNTREWATLIWLLAVGAWLAAKSDLRKSVGQVLKTLYGTKVVFWIVAFEVYVACLVWGATRLGLWNQALLKDTVIWCLGPALVIFISASEASKPGYFSRTLITCFKLSIFLAFFLNLFTFPLAAELIIVPVAFFLVAVPTVARLDPSSEPAVRAANGLASVLGVVTLAYVLADVAGDPGAVVNLETLRELALPIWLTVGVIPIIFVLALAMSYGVVFRGIEFETKDRLRQRRTKLAILLCLRLHLKQVGSLAWFPWVARIVRASSFKSAYARALAYRRYRSRRSPEDEEAELLRELEGSPDTGV